MIREGCRRAAPRAANAGLRITFGAVGCFCLLATVSIETGERGPIGGGVAQAAGDAQTPESEPPHAGASNAPLSGPSADDLQPGRVPPPASGGGGVRDELRAPADPIDFGLGPGATTWLAGPATGHRSAFAATAVLGYTFGDDDGDARLRFRLGALVQYASLHEPNGTDTFLDLLIAPTLRIRAFQQRLFVSLDLGVGCLVLAGLKPPSDFLAHNQVTAAVGTQSIFEVRPGATVSYRLYPAVELFAGPALAWNPKKPHFHEPMLRLQLSGGVALRF